MGMARRIPKEGKAVGSRGIDRMCVTSVMSEETLEVKLKTRVLSSSSSSYVYIMMRK